MKAPGPKRGRGPAPPPRSCVHDVRAPEVDAETKRIKDAAKGEDLGPEVRNEPVAWMQLESTSCEGSLCSGKQIRARIRF